jgi:hypothetical protein
MTISERAAITLAFIVLFSASLAMTIHTLLSA